MYKISSYLQYMVCLVVLTYGVCLFADIDPDLKQKLLSTSDEPFLIQTIQKTGDTNDDIFIKNLACKRLAVMGTDAAIPALTAMLSNEKQSYNALFALQAMPGTTVNTTLQKAAGELKGSFAAKVIDAIGVRKDVSAIKTLSIILEKNPDRQVQRSIYSALAQIGTDEAANVLISSVNNKNIKFETPDIVVRGLGEAINYLGVIKMRQGNNAKALELFQAVTKVNFPVPIREAAIYHSLLAQKSKGAPELIELLISTKDSDFKIALKTITKFSTEDSQEIVSAIISNYSKLPNTRKGLVLFSLAQRTDKVSRDLFMPLFIRQNKETSYSICEGCIKGWKYVSLKDYPDLSSLFINLCDNIYENKDYSVLYSKVANTIISQKNPELNSFVLEKLDEYLGSSLLVKKNEYINRGICSLLLIIEQCRIPEANDRLFKIIKTDWTDPTIRTMALDAAGEVVPLNLLIPFLMNDPDVSRVNRVLKAACVHLPREVCVKQIIELCEKASVKDQEKYMVFLKQIGGKAALDYVANACNKPELIDTATRVLGEWSIADDMEQVADICLKLAKESKDSKYRVRSIRSYVRVPRQFNIPMEKRIAMCKTAFETAVRVDDKLLIFEIFTRIIDVQSVKAALSYTNDSIYRTKACETAVIIAEKINLNPPDWTWFTLDPEDVKKAEDARQQARKDLYTAMENILKISKNQAINDRAQKVMERYK